MTTIVVPYHQDELLPPGLLSLPEHGDYLVLEPEIPPGDRLSRIAALSEAIAAQVTLSVAEGLGTAVGANSAAGAGSIAGADGAGTPGRAPTTVVSGDCLVALGVLAGVQRAGLDPALIWLDAHGDVHTRQTTVSGYLGGLSLRLALGADRELLAGPLGVRPVPEEKTVLVGARDLDPPESDYLAAAAVRRCTVPELTAEIVPEGPLVLHVDLDVIDPGDLPGLLFPAPDGPSRTQVLDAVRRLLATGRVVALDLACTWNPTEDGRARQSRTDLLAALLS
jgi:arginase